MALKMFHDGETTQEVTEENPDLTRKATKSGENLTDERQFWIKSDDPLLTYENISMIALNDYNEPTSGQVDIKYSLDGEIYEDSIIIPNGDFSTPVAIWRKVYSPNIISAFNVTSILHEITADEYVK